MWVQQTSPGPPLIPFQKLGYLEILGFDARALFKDVFLQVLVFLHGQRRLPSAALCYHDRQTNLDDTLDVVKKHRGLHAGGRSMPHHCAPTNSFFTDLVKLA